MMKSFFKKLAFVMALAMVVSMAAPAATTASAAEEMSIGYQNGAVITELNLTEARSSEDLKAVGAPSNWKELGIKWISSNPAVATVDNSGVVTAVAAGTAEIMVTCGDYTATIPVNCFADAKSYDVTIGTADERSITEKPLKVDETFDFAFFGVKDYGRDKVNNAPRYFCEWDSTDTAVATVDKNGLVTAVAEGKAKITLIVWNLATGTKHNVTPTWVTVEAEEEVVTEPSMTVAQTAEDAVKLTFENIDVTKEALEAGLKAYYVINGTKVEYVVAVDKVENGVATVKSYANFVEGFEYAFEYADMEASFEAYIGKPVSIVGSYKCDELDVANKAYTNYNTKISYKIYNEKGMEITDSAMTGAATVEISLVNDVYDGSFTLDTFNQTIFFIQAGKVANIKIEYYTGEVDNNGNRIVGAQTVLPIVSEAEPAYTMASVNWYNTSLNRTTLSIQDIATKAMLQVSFKDTEGNTVETHKLSDARHIGHFSFKSTKDSIVTVDAEGELTPNAVGKANILVYYDYDLLDNAAGNVVAIVPIEVIGNLVLTNIGNSLETISATIPSFYNTADINTNIDGVPFNRADFGVWFSNQLGGGIEATNVSIVCNNKTLPDGVKYLEMWYGYADNSAAGWQNGSWFAQIDNTPTKLNGGGTWYKFQFTAGNDVLGNYSGYTYSYTVTIDGKSTNFSVTVKRPTYDTEHTEVVANGYQLRVPGATDIKVVDNVNQTAKSAFYKVSNGLYVEVVDVNAKPASAAYTEGEYYFTVSGLKHGALALEDATNPYAVSEDKTHAIVVPLTTVDVAYTNLGNTATPGALEVPSYVNKTVNGVDTYSVAVYRATSADKLQIVDQKSFVVNDSQETLTYAGKQQNYFSANTGDVYDLVQKCFKFNFNGTLWTKASEYKAYDNPNVYFDVVYNVNDGSNNGNNDGTMTPGEVYYINSVYFYVPVNSDWDGDTAYIQYIVPVNDYVVIK